MNKFFVIFSLIAVALAELPEECWQGQPDGKSPHECCQLKEAIPMALFEKCKSLFPPPPPGSHPKGCCMSECVLSETKIFAEGKMNKDEALKFLSKHFEGDAETIKVVHEAVEHCDKEYQTKKAGFDEMAKQPAAPGEKVCNMASGFLIGCVNAQIFLNCPKDKVAADASCGPIKSFIDKCGFLYPIKVVH
ncbi:CLUMA_CG019521, isoform A [Clunio marinus]|uniref:CLUMA_CG019521, isoform A n=1 Tax=Clunio marinus TaxID=568069 RepID=A0A1J1J4L6_9DIPT|nr:CLUMA_CG019521, isoform A [Clunio marinus]